MVDQCEVFDYFKCHLQKAYRRNVCWASTAWAHPCRLWHPSRWEPPFNWDVLADGDFLAYVDNLADGVILAYWDNVADGDILTVGDSLADMEIFTDKNTCTGCLRVLRCYLTSRLPPIKSPCFQLVSGLVRVYDSKWTEIFIICRWLSVARDISRLEFMVIQLIYNDA